MANIDFYAQKYIVMNCMYVRMWVTRRVVCFILCNLINSRHAYAARVTVVAPCVPVSLSVCLSVSIFYHHVHLDSKI